MKKKIIMIALAATFLLSGCASENTEATTSTTTTAPQTTTTTPQTTTAPVTTTEVTTEDKYEYLYDKNGVRVKYENGVAVNPVDSDLFWNTGDSDNAGFIIPAERYCTDWDLYKTVEELIAKSVTFSDNYLYGSFGNDEGVFKIENTLYAEVDPDKLYGCSTLSELYEYYLSIHVGEKSYDEFRERIKARFVESEGKLYYGIYEDDSFSGDLWDEISLILYDKTEASVNVMIAIPNDSHAIDGEISRRYSIGATSAKLINGEWRISDSFSRY